MVNPADHDEVPAARQASLTRRSPCVRVSRIVVLAFTALVTACAPLEWQKAGGSEEALKKDLDECREYARVSSWQDASINAMNVPRVVVDPAGRAFVTQNNMPGESDRFLVESDLTRACMERHGYELKPVGSGKAK